MQILFKTLATVLALFPCCLKAQTGSHTLYLLSAGLGSEYRGVRLYRVEHGQGTASQLVREVTKDWYTVLADFDRKKLAIVPITGPRVFAVVDMGAPDQ